MKQHGNLWEIHEKYRVAVIANALQQWVFERTNEFICSEDDIDMLYSEPFYSFKSHKFPSFFSFTLPYACQGLKNHVVFKTQVFLIVNICYFRTLNGLKSVAVSQPFLFPFFLILSLISLFSPLYLCICLSLPNCLPFMLNLKLFLNTVDKLLIFLKCFWIFAVSSLFPIMNLCCWF